ncbi:Karyopherin transporter, partial [Spiromyces aspiralis]
KATQPRLILATLETLLRFLSWIPLGYIFETNLISNLKNRFLEKPETQNVTLKCLTEIGSLQTRPEYDAKLVSLFLMTVESFTNIISVDTDFANDWDKFSDQQQEFIQNMAMFLTIFLSAHLKLVEKHVPQQQVLLAHRYLLRVSQIEERELFKVCLDYWNIFVRGLYEDLNRVPAAQQQPVLNLGPAGDQTPIGATEAQLRHRAYHDVLTGLRYVMISKMAKPEEVLIVENDEGEIVREFIKETDTITLYKAERECLIFLTHLDSSDMENIMLDKLSRQMDRSEWSWNNLNKLCWAIGSISGAMTETQERRFLVVTIKDLLNLCENSRGKDNKAVIAANIMYVVGQYPRFLKAHWKFLKTVTNKLFEFMHEMHEGVRDMACDTFIKIAQKCRRHFIVQQPEESRPFVEEIIENIAQITSDLEPQQVNTFYEAVGTMVGAQPNPDIQQELVTGLMRLPNSMWSKAVLAAGQNSNFLEDSDAVKMMGNVLRINVSTCSAIGKGFLSQIGLIYHDMLALYKAVSEIISATVARDGEVATRYPKIRAMRIIKKEALRLIDVYVRNCGDEIQAVNQNMLPPLLEVVLPDYASN